MKTPMSLEIISNWSLPEPPRHSLTVPDLLSGQGANGRRVGMIIDLANHECLYEEDIPPSIEYAHVQLVAKVLPPPEAIDEVERVASEFWRREPDAYVAIHCAYGFNRTGFVVCSYLCQACGMTVPEALESFAAARPPGVKHGKFVDELYARYGGREESEVPSRTDMAQEGGAAASGRAGLLAGMLSNGNGANSSAPASLDAGENSTIDPGRRSIDVQSEVGSPSASSAPIAIGRGSFSRRSLRSGSSGRSLAAGSQGTLGSAGMGAADEGDVAVSDFTEMAVQLSEKNQMRRETSLGLARALHEDFANHDGTPQRDGLSPLLALLRAEDSVDVEEDANGCAAASEQGLEAAGSGDSTTSPFSSPALSRECIDTQGPKGSAPGHAANAKYQVASVRGGHPRGTPPLPSGAQRPLPMAQSGAATATPRSAEPGQPGLPPWGPRSTPYTSSSLPRNLSIESDNQSLGFGAREVMARLMETRTRSGRANDLGASVRSELDPGDWEDADGATPDSSAARVGPPGNRNQGRDGRRPPLPRHRQGTICRSM